MDDIKNNKSLKPQSFIMDINFLEAPFFLFNQNTKAIKVKDLKDNIYITEEVRHILNLHTNDNGEVKYFSWNDSKGLKREMMAISVFSLPRKFTMDVWYGIVGLYIKKSAPIMYNQKNSAFDIQSDKLYFTLYELAKFMKLTTGGANIKKIKDAIRQLDATQYLSFSNGSIYDKKNEEYVKSKEKGLRLIVNYEFNSEKKKSSSKTTDNKCWVQLNSLVVDNIKHEFIKYLNAETYFTLPSGLTRGLYTYLEGNKYSTNGMLTYIKRNFDVLSNKIPIEYRFNSDLKRRLKKPLQNLIKHDIISDYFYGDEEIINQKEHCIYFIFKGKKEEIIKILREKYQKQLQIAMDNTLEDTSKREFVMSIPKNLDIVLIEIGFSEKVINQLYKDYDKWDIVKYIIWLQKQQFESSETIKNPAGLLMFALMGNVNLKIGYTDIIDFVDMEKEKIRQKKLSYEEILENAYEKYVNDEINKFKNEDIGTYNIIYQNTLINIESQVESQIAQLKLLEKNEGIEMPSLKLWQEFKEKKEESKLFKKNFTNSIKVFRGIMTFEEFKVNFNKK
ncbi:hypothetical protein Z959_12835 [Clostridium novyi B str. ATCC 27606]|uniref:Replication initiator protein A n=2 Tax=Clostridium TaxID=1485 RepID=A0AA40IRS8_CLONO|nr:MULTISPECIES: replication initiator protein A [Clostridium]KEI08564.1 hypothetical protein Z958_12875 [Clostridium novyi B str. NCTC 9691]KEI11975.1 hypothetical protein Z959_12835 [Clostridium novyi B str. ATCC 27606]KEI14466.1 hypothetical protein Z960_12500 [Clostridium haemolyticum NCTC 9693]KGM98760.1 hypothetical protein Z961_12160 [Clostridium haemolyticum NCTC 8350]CAG7839597.1 hypothetical protein CLOHAE12215_01010 [Clostridium haemolyticum]